MMFATVIWSRPCVTAVVILQIRVKIYQSITVMSSATFIWPIVSLTAQLLFYRLGLKSITDVVCYIYLAPRVSNCSVVILQIRVKISQCDVVCYIYLAPSSVHLLLLFQQVIWTSITVMSSGTFVWFSHPLSIYVQGGLDWIRVRPPQLS
jgi:hypothetical protein